MRFLKTLILAASALVAGPAMAQEDEGRIVRFLEEQLSLGDERQVDIQGFRGALSSTAELDRLIISDADGPWLTLEGARLEWSRAALLTGRVEINELVAARLEVSRAPLPADTGIELPEAEASPFSLPDLPVSINVDRFAVEQVVLGAPLLGTEVQLSISGNARLADGEGTTDLEVLRLDGPRGVFDLAASFENESRILALSLLLDEDPSGLAAELLGLPGGPSITLSINGNGPIDDFAADIALATDDTPRLTGQVSSAASDSGDRTTEANLQGDISPLILPEYQGFFGDDVALSATILQASEGGLSVEDLTLRSAALSLTGTLALDANGAPEAFDLSGRVAANDGGPIRLPVPGAEVLLQGTDLVLRYDRAVGDAFEAAFVLDGLDTGDLQVRRLQLDAGGTISNGAAGLSVTSPIRLAVSGLAHEDPALAELLGEAASLSGDISWQQGAPVSLSGLTVRAGDITLDGTAALGFAENRLDLTVDAAANVGDLDRFAAVAGQPLDGSISGQVSGTAEILSGAFDLRLEGGARDLRLADALPADLLAGDTTLEIEATRNTEGFSIETLSLSGQQIALTASGQVNAARTALEASARLANVGLFTDQVSGPATVDLTLDRSGDDAYTTEIDVTGPQDLAARLAGSFTLPEADFDITLDARVRDVPLPAEIPADLLAGQTTLRLVAARVGSDIRLTSLDLAGQNIGLSASGRIDLPDIGDIFGAQGEIQASARLADVGLFTELTDGPASVNLAMSRSDSGPWATTVDASGPQELDLTIAGAVDLPDAYFDVTVDGTVQDVPLPPSLPTTLLAGRTTLSAAVQRNENGLIINSLDLSGTQISATASGQMDESGGAFDARARLANIGLLTDLVTGPVTAEVTARQTGDGAWTTSAGLQGPLGISANVEGDVGLPNNAVDLRARGSVPLALANRALQPRSVSGVLIFDMSVQGQPGLDAVNGNFSARGVRVTLPTLQNALQGLSVNGRIANGVVDFDANGGFATGGSLRADGSVTVSSPSLPARISVSGSNLRFIDPSLYNVLIESAEASINGALVGSMQVTGDIRLGESEIRVPEGGAGGAAPIPDIRHVSETALERQTRAAAGLIRTDQTSGSQRIALNLTINAPGRVFIRGRGLDAELGGILRIGGTTADMVPSGRFELIRGRLSILGTRLDLNEGSATMQGSFDPFIRLLASSRAGGYTINIGLIGPVSNPEISITSDPALPEDEVLAQLLFGRSASALSPIQLLRMADAAASLAGGSSESGIFANLREGLGLDDLDLQTDSAGNASVRAGRYLSENVYADVVVGSEETDLSLNIDLTPNITARGTFSSSGNSSVGVFYERDY